MSSRGAYNEIKPHNAYKYHSYENDDEEKKESTYSDSEYSSSFDHPRNKSSQKRLRNLEYTPVDSNRVAGEDSKMIIK